MHIMNSVSRILMRIAIFSIISIAFGSCIQPQLQPPFEIDYKPRNVSKQYPQMGRAMRSEFFFKEDFILFDHGAYGTYPRTVQTTLHEFQTRIESNPDLWIKREAKIEVTKIRQQLASFVNAPSEDSIVLIPNTTSGMNAIFRSLILGLGERILHFSTVYGSMGSIIQYLIDHSPNNISRLVFNVTYPTTNDKIVADFAQFLENEEDSSRPIKIALIDHISSSPAVILPLERLIPLLKERGIRVLVDGAHAIGQIPVDIQALQPDYYITNAHKWLYAARGCAMMYVDEKWQGEVHPALINSGYKRPADFQEEFFWTGTMDYSPYMTVTAALKFREDIGGEAAVRNYTNSLARAGGAYLAGRYGTEVMQNEDQMGSMVDVRLPIANPEDPQLNSDFWIDMQLYEHPQVYASVYKHGGSWWARHSCQIYNDAFDFAVVADSFLSIVNGINEKYAKERGTSFNKIE